MLVLSRKTNQDIVIGDDVVVRVVRIVGDKVRLGVEAPQDVSIHRREVWQETRPPGAVPGPSGQDAGRCPSCGHAPAGRVLYRVKGRHVCGECLWAEYERLVKHVRVIQELLTIEKADQAMAATKAALPADVPAPTTETETNGHRSI